STAPIASGADDTPVRGNSPVVAVVSPDPVALVGVLADVEPAPAIVVLLGGAHGVGTPSVIVASPMGNSTSASAGVACTVANASGTSSPPAPDWNAIPPRSAGSASQPACSASNAVVPGPSGGPSTASNADSPRPVGSTWVNWSRGSRNPQPFPLLRT